jgi:signal transduction histidine kinase
VSPSLSVAPRMSLATQFALGGGAVMLVATLLVGLWVSNRIEEAVVRNTANATALYMESFLSPLSQDLEKSDTLSPGARRALDEIFTNTPLGKRVVSFKIWKDGGLVMHASNPEVIGKRFEVDDDLARAWAGEVRGSFGALETAENRNEHALNIPLLEIYSPIREVWSGRIIGVAEFYEVADVLAADLSQARWRSWGAVALVMLTIAGSLYAIVLRGSRTIDSQRAALTSQLGALRDLSDQNVTLRRRVQDAAARSSAMSDQAQRQVGADLHDGPAQLLGFVALRLDQLRDEVKGDAGQQDLDQIDRAVKDAMREIRSIARGLSLPEIESRSPAEVVRNVVDAHCARTGTNVTVTGETTSFPELSPAVKICLYRFVQEGLNNAWRHSEGQGQTVDIGLVQNQLSVIVGDTGQGVPDAPLSVSEDGGMGLSGLRDRVESLGGTLELVNRAATAERAAGADLRMKLELEKPE